ncbi:MAG TPA: HEAT repeat domain-containing protein [Kofleriaceae bacterium]|nr:HEAT repeat domain-containing protein [Kofleriaceae bacterium]
MRAGSWIERLEAIAVARETVAVGGRRDAAGVTTAQAHVLPVSLLDDKGAAWVLDTRTAVHAIAYAGDELVLTGGDDGRLVAWDVTGQRVGGAAVGAGIRAIALEPGAARGDAGTIAVATVDGALHLIKLAFANGAPAFESAAKHALSGGPITCVTWDPAGLWVAGGADGQLRVIGESVRAIAPGGDGGIRAVVCLGDGRAIVGCGDGSIRACFVVGDVEATDRSGDFGHAGAVRGLVLGPVIVDDAGREQPRRMFSVGEDGALKAWFVDGARRPRTIELGIGPCTALAFAPGPIAKIEKAIGRLWIAASSRKVAALALGADADPVGDPVVIGSLLDAYEATLRDGKAAVKVKLEIVAQLTTIAEDEARILLDYALGNGPPEVRVAATQAMVRGNRRASRPALRAALGAGQPELRGAAFHALRDLERDQPIVAIRAGLAARFEDVRVRAVEALIPLAQSSVIAAGLVADALRDDHPTVRRRAFAALVQIAPDPESAVRTALARGHSDVRAEALLYLGLVVKAADRAARELTAAAFDDPDHGVRSAAFLAAVMQRPRLAARVVARVPSVAQTLQQVAQQLSIPLQLPADDDRELDDDELEPLFAQLACRHADAAIRGAGTLLALGDPRAIGAVLQLTREPDPALRRGATENLVLALAANPDDDRLSARLAWLLDDPDRDVRNYAFDALARIATAAGGDAELDLAELALRTSQEDIRVRALQILVRVGAPGSAVHDRASGLLGDALDDEAQKVRAEAFRTLWAWHTANPLIPIGRGATSRHADLRMQVVAEIERRRAAKQSSAELDRLLRGLVSDAVPQVALAAYKALTAQPEGQPEVPVPADVHLAAMASPAPSVRAAGAAGAKRAPAAAVRARLVELIKDDHPAVHLAAIEALDAVAPGDPEGFALAFASIFYELQVRACELCGQRRDPKGIAPAQRLLSIPKTDVNRPHDAFRQRAARALADIGSPTTIAFLQGLIEDEDPIVREMAARGLATAAEPGNEQARSALVALLGHNDLPVRSWGGEGLAKLGDLRALPVLAGTQRHDHRPLRIGAIVGFVALGPDGVRGLRQGLEDRDREIQDLAFAVIVARDVALAQAGIAPDLLVDAMSSPSPEIRFAAARLFERRAAGEPIASDLIAELVGPRKPEKAADMKDWPPAERRAAILQVVADAIASDQSTQRYAAAQVLAVRTQPLTFWREAARLSGPSRGAPSPHTGWSTERRIARRTGWLRRLVGERRDPEAPELENLARLFLRAGQSTSIDRAAAQRLVFGVYAGLVRQAPARGEADETHRVRRDALARLAELAHEEAVGAEAVQPVLAHAVGDPHHLVRGVAMTALRSLYPVGALAPLAMAIAGAADLGKAAIDELVAIAGEGDDRAAALVRAALDADDPDVRAYAALRLPKLYAAGSAQPQLLAAQSRHADVRLAAITQLATAADPSPAIIEALTAALGSEHADLRLRAAVALAKRGNSTGIDVLAAFLRTEEHAAEALRALVGLADGTTDTTAAAAEAIAARLDDDPDRTADRRALLTALGKLGDPRGAPAIVRLLTQVQAGKESEVEPFAGPATSALLDMLRDRTAKLRALPDGRTRVRYRDELALPQLAELARSPLASVRTRVASALGDVDDRGAEDVLARLLGDRVAEVRVAAAEALALRAEYVPGATLTALEAALRGGRRELVLPAALGLAARKRPEAFQPLLLVAKAGEGGERERALLALGSLGDVRALDHLLPLLEPAPEDEASRALTPAAVEALGRLVPALSGDPATEVRERVERLALGGTGAVRLRALSGLRYAGDLGTLRRVAADRETTSDVRGHAIRQLGLAASTQSATDTTASEAVLAELLADDDRAIRDAGVAALTKVLGGDRTRVSLHALGSPHDDVSRPAATYLATAGDPATLVARLGTVKSAETRRMLREGLIRRGALPQPELAAVLAGSDPAARAEASWIAGYAGDAARAIANELAGSVARSATQATQSKATPARPAELEAWWAGMWAARRVGAAGTVAVEAAAIGALDDDRLAPAVRREAAGVLATIGAGSALGALGRVLGDPDREVRAIASAAVAERQPERAADAVRALGSRADATTIAPLAWRAWPELASELVTEPSTRSSAIAITLAGARIDELLAIATGRGATDARIAAIAALARFDEPRVLEALEAIHRDDGEDDAIKLAAWKSIKRIVRRAAKTYAEGQDKGPKGTGGGGGGGGGRGDDDDDDDGGGDGDDGDDDDGGDDEDGNDNDDDHGHGHGHGHDDADDGDDGDDDDDDDDDDDGANDWSDVIDDDDDDDDDEGDDDE